MNSFSDNTHSTYVDFDSKFVQRIAAQYGARYTHLAMLDSDETGLYANPNMIGLETDRLRFSIDDAWCEYYVGYMSERTDELLNGIPEAERLLYASRYKMLVYSMDLPFEMPAMYIESRLNAPRVRRVSRWLPDMLRTVELEGNFNQFFHVYVAEKVRAITAFEVLAPDVMYELLALGDDIDVEFAGNRIYFYKFLDRKATPLWVSLQGKTAADGTSPLLKSWEHPLSLKSDDYVKYLAFYTRVTRKFYRAARLVSVDRSLSAVPLYRFLEEPKRKWFSSGAKGAIFAYIVPAVVMAILILLLRTDRDTAVVVDAVDGMALVMAVMLVSVIVGVGAGLFIVPNQQRDSLWRTWHRITTRGVRRRLIKRYGDARVDLARAQEKNSYLL